MSLPVTARRILRRQSADLLPAFIGFGTVATNRASGVKMLDITAKVRPEVSHSQLTQPGQIGGSVVCLDMGNVKICRAEYLLGLASRDALAKRIVFRHQAISL